MFIYLVFDSSTVRVGSCNVAFLASLARTYCMARGLGRSIVEKGNRRRGGQSSSGQGV